MKKTAPPPLYNLEAETSLIGAALLAEQEVLKDPAVKIIQPGDFWDKRNQDTWAAILKLAEEGKGLDQVTVADELDRHGQLEAVGGAADLLAMINACPSHAQAPEYASIVLNWSRRRKAQAVNSTFGAALLKDNNFDDVLREHLESLALISIMGASQVESCTMEDIRKYFGNVAFAWPGWIPVGHLTLIVGPQGTGKSYFTTRLIATLTGHTSHWPDGTPVNPNGFDKLPAKVLLLETEEMRGVYAERLEKMGVGEHRVIFGPGDVTHIPDLLKEASRIEQLARQEDVCAIAIDSLSGGHDLKEDSAEMRRLLKCYTAMASRLHLPVIIVHHPNKRRELELVNVTLDRVRGSSTITQFCRSVIALYRLEDGDQIGPVRVESIKSTFCAPPKPLGFTIGDDGLSFGKAPEPLHIETQEDKACDVLLSLLKDGPIASSRLQEEAQDAGISWRTMNRAKDRLGIVAKREKKPGSSESRWYWALPAVGGEV